MPKSAPHPLAQASSLHPHQLLEADAISMDNRIPPSSFSKIIVILRSLPLAKENMLCRETRLHVWFRKGGHCLNHTPSMPESPPLAKEPLR